MHIFSEQTFTDTYTEIYVDISNVNKDTKQSGATCQNAEKRTKYSDSYQQIYQ